MNVIEKIINERVMLLDGATGTLLQERGMPAGVCPELWCVEHPEVISSIYSDYADAGADAVYSCSFGGNRFKLSQYGDADVFEINKRLTQIAVGAVGSRCLVAGDIGPTGKFVEPFGELPFEDAVDAFKEQVKGLDAGGVDFFAIETQIDIQEARAALIAVKESSDKPVMVTMTFEEDGCTLNGTPPAAALVTLQALGADVVGCNCSVGPACMIEYVKQMKPYAKVPLVVKPNAGMPQIIDGNTVFDMGVEEFASYSERFIDEGVSIIGGCCGTKPSHIEAVKQNVKTLKPNRNIFKNAGTILSSARGIAEISAENRFSIIGERINPTGKKTLQAELLDGKFSLLKKMARDQFNAGAVMLDVNVGMPGINEKEKLSETVKFLAGFSTLPLVLDSSDPDAMCEALRVYPGRALINSVSLEKKRLEGVLPLAAKYGAAFIALPLSDDEIPKTSAGRIDLIKKLVFQAENSGLRSDDIVVDALAMAVSADANAGNTALATIKWCRENDLQTTLGLSNISFGLPQRKWVNSAFVTLAISAGLTSAIANPCDMEFANIKVAADLLLGKDENAETYLQHFSDVVGRNQRREEMEDMPIEQQIYQSIIDGTREDVIPLVNKAIEQNVDIDILVHDYMIKAISETGDLFARQIYFLPQLIASSETMKAAFAIVEPLIISDDAETRSAGKILMATVEGDIHDIGKNIVVLLLQNHGCEVIDLGKDVSAEDVLAAVKEHKPDMVGLSALMTTTMVKMPEIIRYVHDNLVNQQISFVIGGAVITPSFAESIGAHYAADGVQAVNVMKEKMQGNIQ